MKKSLTPIIFWLLMASFLVVASEFFVPLVRELFRGSLLFLVPIIIFFFLGLALLISTLKEKVQDLLKKFLILTSASAVGFFTSIVLHNFFYALGIIANNITMLKYLMEILHVAFFIIAIFVCPIGFLFGMIGSIVLFIKEGLKKHK